MTNLPTKTDLTSTSTSEASFQAAIGAVYDVIGEIAGANGHAAMNIVSGSITPLKGIVYLNTESNATSDDLDFVVPSTLGSKVIIIKPQYANRAINIRHNQTGAGKLWTMDGQPALLRSPEYTIAFYYNATNSRWEEVYRNFGLTLMTDAAEKTAFKALLDFSSYMLKADNLSGLADVSAARTNLGLGTMAVAAASAYLAKSDNLSGLTNLPLARSNLGLGTGSVANAGTGANQLVQLDGFARIPAVDGSLITNIPGQKKARFIHSENNNVGGGARTAGAWSTQTLNTKVYDDIGITLASNQMQQLTAGTYEIKGYSLFGATNFGNSTARLKLYNVTDSAVIANTLSGSGVISTANAANIMAWFNSVRFTLAATKNILIQYFCAGATAAFASNTGDPEIYADIVLTKIS